MGHKIDQRGHKIIYNKEEEETVVEDIIISFFLVKDQIVFLKLGCRAGFCLKL